MKSTFILNHINQLLLFAATYVPEYISENLFSALSATISTQKKLGHVNLDIWESQWSRKSPFAKTCVCKMRTLFDFLNL